MLATNLKVIGVVLATILLYTMVANAIPQVQSEVPEELSLGADFTTEEIVAAGQELYLGAGGCTACHGTGTRAPDLVDGGNVGARCGTQLAGMSCKEYLHASLVDPNAFVVAGFQPIMPAMNRTLSDAQIWALVAYLESQGGEVTVTAEDLAAAGGAESGSSATAGPAPASTSMDPLTLLAENQCLVCHVMGDQGGPIGPALTDVGTRLDEAGIRRAILDPNAEISPGFEAVAGTMPTTFGSQFTAAQLEAVVQYLAAQR